MNIDTEKMHELVTQKVSDEFFNFYHETWKVQIAAAVNMRVDALISQVAGDTIKSRVEQITADAFHTTYRPLDSFGRQSGEPTTIAKTLEAATRDYWSTKVGKNGTPVDPNSYSSRDAYTRAEHFIAKAMGESVEKTFDQELIVNMAARVKETIRDNLRGAIDQKLAAVFHVQTPLDKAEGRAK